VNPSAGLERYPPKKPNSVPLYHRCGKQYPTSAPVFRRFTYYPPLHSTRKRRDQRSDFSRRPQSWPDYCFYLL